MIRNERLLNVFEMAHIDFYSDELNKSQKSANWKKYDQRIFNLRNLINFREKGGLSSNCDDSNRLNLAFDFYAEIVKKIGEEFILKNMDNKNIGNCPSSVFYNNVYVDPNRLMILCWFYILEISLKRVKFVPNSLCEIGGGYGCFSDILIKNFDLKLLSIDLPEANIITAYYLKEKYPSKSFFLYDNYIENNLLSFKNFEENDIIILPPNCNIDERIKFDLFINTRSMMEMNFNIIESYFEFINTHISKNGYFLNINRYEKRTVGEAIRFADYPYGKDWEVVHSEPSPYQHHIHYLLTRKTTDSEKQNIQSLLENIRKYVLVNPKLKGPGGFSPQNSTYPKK